MTASCFFEVAATKNYSNYWLVRGAKVKNRTNTVTEGGAAQSAEILPDPTPGATPSARGVSWLRYAGVGPARRPAGQPAQKISGADVTSLGSLEAEVMGLLWELGRPANGMEVAEASLYKRRAQGQQPIAFATVNTTLRRLADKGLLVGEKHETRTPYYSPTVGREEMAARILNNVSVTLLGQTFYGLIPRLTGSLKPRKGHSEDAAEQIDLFRLMQALETAAGTETVETEDTVQ
jgi:predicted transcriptional regulator